MTRLTKETIEKIQKEAKNGKTMYKISKELNIPYQSIRYHTKENAKQKTKQYSKKYEKTHPEAVRLRKKRYYNKNKEKLKIKAMYRLIKQNIETGKTTKEEIKEYIEKGGKNGGQ